MLLQYTGNSENVISETDDLAITRRKLFEHLKGTQLNVVLCNWVRSHSAHTFLLRAENGLLSFGMHAGPHDRGKIVINVLVGAFFMWCINTFASCVPVQVLSHRDVVGVFTPLLQR